MAICKSCKVREAEVYFKGRQLCSHCAELLKTLEKIGQVTKVIKKSNNINYYMY